MSHFDLQDVFVGEPVKPFLRWPGGKRWILPHLQNILRARRFRFYFEPFLGGGAVFFHLNHRTSYLSDINGDLINLYIQVKERPNALIRELKRIPVSKESYLEMRASDPQCQLKRAVRFLYLNRTAFSGMYRLNKAGKFNVPYGGGIRTAEPLWEDNLIPNACKTLQKAIIKSGDFGDNLKMAGKDDLVYCDPTYITTHNNNGFIRYNENNFSWADQIRLAEVCSELRDRGATIIVSNACNKEIAYLYPDAEIYELVRKSLLCPTVSKRQPVKEYLFLLNPKSLRSEPSRFAKYRDPTRDNF